MPVRIQPPPMDVPESSPPWKSALFNFVQKDPLGLGADPSGGIGPAPMGAVVRPDQVIKSINNYAAARGFPITFTDRLLSSVLKELRQTPSWAERQWKNVGKGETQLWPLSEGGEALAIGVQPGQKVLKLFAPWRYEGNMRSPFDILANPPDVFLRPEQWGVSPSGRLGYMVQPYAQPLATVEAASGNLVRTAPRDMINRVTDQLMKRADKQGWKFTDTQSGNIGIYKGEPYVIDAGSLRRR